MFEVKNRATTALSHPTTQSTVRGNKDFVFHTETQKLVERGPFVHLTPKKRGHDLHLSFLSRRRSGVKILVLIVRFTD